jgi:hypothetical protein
VVNPAGGRLLAPFTPVAVLAFGLALAAAGMLLLTEVQTAPLSAASHGAFPSWASRTRSLSAPSRWQRSILSHNTSPVWPLPRTLHYANTALRSVRPCSA